MIKVIALTFILIITFVNFLFADEYFLTLRYSSVNLRQGPSFDYPVKIFYKKKYLPLQIQDTSGNFRKVKDHENNTGWIHRSQLSKKKAALVSGKKVVIFKSNTIFSEPLVVLEKGRLCLVSKCKKDWCKIKVDKYLGWVKKKNLWGNI